MAGNDNSLIIKINGTAKQFLDELDKVNKATKQTQEILKTTAKVASVAFLALAGSVAFVTKSFADFETSLVGVGKTTNISGTRLKKFGREIQDLSKRIPIAANDLLGMAQAAGQLGVAEKDLLIFTETVAKLGVATDLSGEEAAIALTRILTVTREGTGAIAVFGSQIVALGNQFAATEKEIVRMATEVSRSTAIFGVNAGQSAALGTALRAIGVRAELGGSAVGRAFRAISKAVNKGGTPLRAFIDLTGRTGEELKRVFEKDSVKAFQIFLEGLNSIDPKDVTDALAQFGLKGEEILKVLPVLAQNSDLVARALAVQAKEAKNATALNKEAAAAFDTLNSEAQFLKNEITALSVTLGAQFAEDARALLKNVKEIVANFQNLDKETISLIASFLKWATIIAGGIATLAAFGLVAIKISAILQSLLITFGGATLAAGTFWAAVTGPIGIAVAGIALITVGVIALVAAFSTAEKEIPRTLDNINLRLDKMRQKQKALNKELADASPIQRRHNRVLRMKAKELALIDKEIKALEKLRKKQIETSEDFGTGALLRRPTVTTGDFDFSIPGLPETKVEIPFAIDPAAREAEVAKELEGIKKSEEFKGKILDEAAQKRIDARKSELAKLNDANFLANLEDVSNLTETQKQIIEKDFELSAQRRVLKEEEKAANLIANDEERQIALESVQVKHETLLQAEVKFNDRKAEVNAEEIERQKDLDEELRELTLEERNNLNEEDLEQLQGQLQTEDEADRLFAKQKAARQLRIRMRHQQDVRQHGIIIADLNKFFNSQEVSGIQTTTANLAQLRRSSSKKMQVIGKAAARINAALATAQGAIQAYTSLAVIPIIGPALGAAAAGVLIAFGLEQQRKIDSVQAARGGIVGNLGTSGGARDRIPAFLEPGELVTPKALVPDFIQAVGRPEGGAGTSGIPQVDLTIKFSENAFDLIQADRDERISLNLINEEGA